MICVKDVITGASSCVGLNLPHLQDKNGTVQTAHLCSANKAGLVYSLNKLGGPNLKKKKKVKFLLTLSINTGRVLYICPYIYFFGSQERVENLTVQAGEEQCTYLGLFDFY